jgi:pSer/pThr/pTyr-binding forkhead associated (FHA) protein
MLDCGPMSELRLRFSDGDQPDLVVGAGVHALGRLPTGLGPVDAEQPWLLRVSNDRRGLWLTVAEGLRGVHVNGRPVQHVAMLRAGDSIHVDGGELLLVAANDGRAVAPVIAGRDPVGNLRLVLRGLGGSHHGRSLNLEKPRRIGSAADADLRIDGPGIAPQHAVLEAVNGQAVLRDAAADVQVNGQRVRHALLQAGDQVAFDVQHRFVLEGPPPAAAVPPPRARDGNGDAADEVPAGGRRHWTLRIPWLLLAAILLSAALSVLLLFGER